MTVPASFAPVAHRAAEMFDAMIVGGGFYGCSIAAHLGRAGWRVGLVEREATLMARASYVNQARLHNGYHYPRSFRTAMRSRANLPSFRASFPEAVEEGYRALYAVARQGSRVSGQHFERFCRMVGTPLRRAAKSDRALFDLRQIECVYEVEEPAFNALRLRERLAAELASLPVTFLLGRSVDDVAPLDERTDDLACRLEDGTTLAASWVFNCTYANLNHIAQRWRRDRFDLVQQIAEVALIAPPPELAGRGVTVMDGPFFSSLPFPPRGLHSLTHVRYTHHARWSEGEVPSDMARHAPDEVLRGYLECGGARGRTRFPWMIRSARRYLPLLGDVELADTLIDIKTLLAGTRVDDARPILFHRDSRLNRLISVLGGKIDNIFDMYSYLDQILDAGTSTAATGLCAVAGGAGGREQ